MNIQKAKTENPNIPSFLIDRLGREGISAPRLLKTFNAWVGRVKALGDWLKVEFECNADGGFTAYCLITNKGNYGHSIYFGMTLSKAFISKKSHPRLRAYAALFTPGKTGSKRQTLHSAWTWARIITQH